MWWVGCHGGAGVSTLARLAGFGGDAGVTWPRPQPGTEPAVVLVCRATAYGTWAAADAVGQWRDDPHGLGLRLLGLAVVAATPRRMPTIATQRLRLLRGWVPAMWRIGWVDALLAADDPADVGPPPDVISLCHAVAAMETEATR